MSYHVLSGGDVYCVACHIVYSVSVTCLVTDDTDGDSPGQSADHMEDAG